MSSDLNDRHSSTAKRAKPHAHFARRLSLRVVALFGLMLVTCLVFAFTDYWVTPIVLVLLCLAILAELLHYVQRSNRDLARFLRQIEFDDYAQRMPINVGGTGFEPLAEAIDRMIERIGARRLEQAQALRTLTSIIENVPSPLISINQDGNVKLQNHAARRLFADQPVRNREQLAAISPDLLNAIEQATTAKRSVIRLQIADDAPRRMALSLASLQVGDERLNLINLQNISSDLEASELEAWEQMARVLSHEIMNSLTPVASLATTAGELLDENRPDARAKARLAIETVSQRASSLTNFIQSYRQFARLPEPNRTLLDVQPVLAEVLALFQNDEANAAVEWSLKVTPKSLAIDADRKQIEQVLINLIKNALQAVAKQTHQQIHIQAKYNRNARPVIAVIDNGPGIPSARQDQIFVPYFSTRRGGSGIGLALAKQVMRAHGGSISVSNDPQGGAIFRLLF